MDRDKTDLGAGNRLLQRVRIVTIVAGLVAILVMALALGDAWRGQHESARQIAEQQVAIAEMQRQLADLKKEIHEQKLGSFVPLPSSAGPAYVFNGQMTTGSGISGAHTTGAEPIFEPVCVGAGTQKVWTSGPLANGEGYDLDINAQLVTDAGGVMSHCRREWHGTNVNGVFEWADGGLTDISTLNDFGGLLATGSCALGWDAGGAGQLPTLALNVSTDAGACVTVGLSNQRTLPPAWPARSIDQVVPASLGTTLASPVVVQVLGTHDIFASTVSAISLGATGLTNLGACNSGASTDCVQGTLAAATYTGGSVTVSVTTAAGAFTIPNGFTFSSGTINTISPTSGPNVLASPYSVALGTSTGAATGSCTASIGSTALTGCSPSGGNTINCSIPSGTYTVGSYTVSATCTGSGVLTPLVNGFTFSTTPTLTATSFPVGVARGGATLAFKGSNFAAGMTCNFGSTTGVPTTITDSAHAACVIPSGTATGSAINFSVTLAGQTSNTKNFYYYPNSVVELHIPAIAIDTGFPASPGQTVSTWVDQAQVGPYNLTQATGANQLTLTTSWLNSWPGYTNVSGTHYMTSAIPSTAQPLSINGVADATTATDSFTGFLWSGTTSGGRNDLLNDNGSSCGAGRRISFFAGAANTACVASAFNLSSAHAVGGTYNGSAANASLFYGDRTQIANSNGTSVGSDPLVGLTIFTRYDQATPWPGDLGEVEVLAGVSAAQQESDLTTIIQPIQKLNWGTP
jgi:hypothetical protein